MQSIRSIANAPATIINAAIMRWRSQAIATVIVEGASDQRFFKPLFDERRVFVTPADGKRTVLDAYKVAKQMKFNFARFIVDLDRDRISGAGCFSDEAVAYIAELPESGVHFANDLECLLIRVGALRKVWAEYDSPLAYENFERKLILSSLRLSLIRSLLWSNVSPRERQSALCADALMDYELIEINEDRQQAAFKTWGENSPSQLLMKLQSMQVDCEERPWEYLRGHDLTAITAGHVSTAATRRIPPLEIERMLRAAVHWSHISETPLGKRLMSWTLPRKGLAGESPFIAV